VIKYGHLPQWILKTETVTGDRFALVEMCRFERLPGDPGDLSP
jgi:hypothetical protein